MESTGKQIIEAAKTRNLKPPKQVEENSSKWQNKRQISKRQLEHDNCGIDPEANPCGDANEY